MEENDHDNYDVPTPVYDFGSKDIFFPKEDDFEDDDDAETLMGGNTDCDSTNDVVIKSFDLLLESSPSEGASISSQNPITGNVIICSKRNNCWYIDEVEVSRKNAVVSTMEISCQHIQRKMKDIMVCGIKEVMGMAAGVQFSGKKRKVFVVAILSLYALGSTETINIFATWNWGRNYDAHQSVLENIISVPALDYEYDPTSFIAADGLIFMPATIRRKPVVLVSRPSVCSIWVSYYTDIETSNSSDGIRGMDVCPEAKLVALINGDEKAYIWNYTEVLMLDSRFPTINQMNILYVLDNVKSIGDISSNILFPTADIIHQNKGKICVRKNVRNPCFY
jgi:hypothetical protein